MIKQTTPFLIMLFSVYLLALFACNVKTETVNSQDETSLIEADATLAIREDEEETEIANTQEEIQTYVTYIECGHHVPVFHGYKHGYGFMHSYRHGYEFITDSGLISEDEIREWVLPLRALRTSLEDPCIENIVILIEHFEISREDLQQAIDNSTMDWPYYDLDILYSGDWALINDIYGERDNTGDEYIECERHISAFHGNYGGYDLVLGAGLVNEVELGEWLAPLLELRLFPDTPCLENLVTLIEYFDISREVFQQAIDDHPLLNWLYYDLDVLYSDDWALINEYYSIENEISYWRQAEEQRASDVFDKFMGLQQIVYNNTSEHSKYYYDIWTLAYFLPLDGKEIYYSWMKELIDAGEHEKVNIVQLVNNKGLEERTFSLLVKLDNMNLFTHYNTDIIFSGDQALIDSYYAKENEPTHAKLVQEAFDAYAALHGAPDTSWMLK